VSDPRAVNEFRLADSDRATGLWQRLKAHLEDRLVAARLRNDDPALSETQTAALRGEVKTLKSLLLLDADRPFETGKIR
jgi:hypothetical protein